MEVSIFKLDKTVEGFVLSLVFLGLFSFLACFFCLYRTGKRTEFFCG